MVSVVHLRFYSIMASWLQKTYGVITQSGEMYKFVNDRGISRDCIGASTPLHVAFKLRLRGSGRLGIKL
jgi:hypothetical protein